VGQLTSEEFEMMGDKGSKDMQQFCLLLDTAGRWRWLRTEAFRRECSMADIIRELIDRARGGESDGIAGQGDEP
jgi:hypothetical protein